MCLVSRVHGFLGGHKYVCVVWPIILSLSIWRRDCSMSCTKLRAGLWFMGVQCSTCVFVLFVVLIELVGFWPEDNGVALGLITVFVEC